MTLKSRICKMRLEEVCGTDIFPNYSYGYIDDYSNAMKWVNRVPFEFVYTRVTTPSFPAMELASRTFTGRLVTNPLMDFWNHQWKDLNSVITLWARIFAEMDLTASFES